MRNNRNATTTTKMAYSKSFGKEIALKKKKR